MSETDAMSDRHVVARADDSGAVARRADRSVGLRQEHLRAHALRAVRDALVGLLPRSRLERRERSSRRRRRRSRCCTSSRQSGSSAGCSRSSTRRTCSRRRASRSSSWRAVSRSAGRDRPRSPGARLPGAQQDAAGSRRSARTSSASSTASCAARCATCSARAFGTCTFSSSEEEIASVTIERQPLWNNREVRSRTVRHHRRRARLRDELEELLDAARLRARDAAGASGVTPHGRKAVFVGDLVDRGPRDSRRAAHRRWRWSTRGRRLRVPGNHDLKLVREAARHATCRSRTAWPSRSRSSKRETPEFRERVADIPRRPRQPLRARRRPARRRARRA